MAKFRLGTIYRQTVASIPNKDADMDHEIDSKKGKRWISNNKELNCAIKLTEYLCPISYRDKFIVFELSVEDIAEYELHPWDLVEGN